MTVGSPSFTEGQEPRLSRTIVTQFLKEVHVGIHRELYDFAASAGAFEGYVYHPSGLDPGSLPKWAGNLVKQYEALPADVRGEIQDMCDGTIGRAVRSLIPVLGESHEVVEGLKAMIKGELPASPDDFDKH
jgi:hypothetical protein